VTVAGTRCHPKILAVAAKCGGGRWQCGYVKRIWHGGWKSANYVAMPQEMRTLQLRILDFGHQILHYKHESNPLTFSCILEGVV
jgi:hypothetical protein